MQPVPKRCHSIVVVRVTGISMLENGGELRLIKCERAKGKRDRKTASL